MLLIVETSINMWQIAPPPLYLLNLVGKAMSTATETSEYLFICHLLVSLSCQVPVITFSSATAKYAAKASCDVAPRPPM